MQFALLIPKLAFMYLRIYLVISILVCSWSSAWAQVSPMSISDTSATEKNSNLVPIAQTTDTISAPVLVVEPFVTPKKKAMFSAMVPGLGQIYNRQYWKLPLVYGGLATCGYFIYYNTDKYNYYRRIYAGRISNNPEYLNMEAKVSTENIKRLQDSYRSDRDMTVMITVLVYGLQIMDALVFAHLKEFDISDNISMKVGPKSMPNIGFKPTMGVGMVFNFKK